ncbi:MAG: EF-hand domain-containing protein [Proteobacteria bacterium]|nr:EF-hand domain-containing protein [Pseudomonadota bacterium]
MTTKSLLAACTIALLSLGTACAQGVQEQPQPAQQEPAAPNDHRGQMIQRLNQRFSEADVNGDGMLSREEAAAKMPGVAAHFDQLDVDHKGYLTKRDVLQGMRKLAADRKAERMQE